MSVCVQVWIEEERQVEGRKGRERGREGENE